MRDASAVMTYSRLRACAAPRCEGPGGRDRKATAARERPGPRVSHRLNLGVTLGSLFLSACHDEANYVGLGVCIGILVTGGFVIAFLETWLDLMRKCGRDERDQLEAELEARAEVHAAPETRR